MFQHQKVGISQLNRIMCDSIRYQFSLYGLFLIAIPLIVGGGLMTLIMKRVEMGMLGYFIVQPAVLTAYAMMFAQCLKSKQAVLSPSVQTRNLVFVIALGLLLTVVLLLVLWALRFYLPGAHAAETANITASGIPIPENITPEVVQAPELQFYELYRVYFNVFSFAFFTICILLPWSIFLISSLSRSTGNSFYDLKIACVSIVRNLGLLFTTSVLSAALLVAWSSLSAISDWLVFTSVFPFSFISVVLFRISCIALPVQSDTNKDQE